jgi:hypothetical protein
MRAFQKREQSPVTITLEVLRTCFDLPLHAAASKLVRPPIQLVHTLQMYECEIVLFFCMSLLVASLMHEVCCTCRVFASQP